MRNHRISLQDIATLAGVTKMTVSRYIRSPKKVAKETGERIAKIMEEINYIPNRAPGMLLNAQSYTLGILIPSFQNQLFADILAGIESVTSEHNYQTLIANYNYDRDSEEESVINLLSYNIDGIILSEKYHTIRTVKFLRSATIPVVELMDHCQPAERAADTILYRVQDGLCIHPFGKSDDGSYQNEGNKAVNFKADHQDKKQRDACRNND